MSTESDEFTDETRRAHSAATRDAIMSEDPILRAIWPDLTMPHRRSPRSFNNARRPKDSYLAVPDATTPRYILPAGRSAATSVVRHFGASGTNKDAVRNLAMRSALRATGRIPLRSVPFEVLQSAHGLGEGIEEHLADVLGTPIKMGVHLGHPRANRKPVVQLIDHNNQLIGFAKMGMNSLTRPLVRREGNSIEQLARCALGPVIIPEVISQEVWRGFELLLLAPLPIPKKRRTVDRPLRREAMLAVARSLGTNWSTLADSQYVAGLFRSIQEVPDESVRNRLHTVLSGICVGHEEAPFGAWHGDWTVWNMAQAGTDLLLWDWERFTTGVPLGFDELHFELGANLRRLGATTRASRRLLDTSPGVLTTFGVPEKSCRAVASLYLLELTLRYMHDHQRESGGHNAYVEDWVVPTLEDHWVRRNGDQRGLAQ